MHRAGFVPYGPSRVGSEALSRIMAADVRDTSVAVNLLLPGGATATGTVPDDMPPDRELLESAVMGPPIVWLASQEAAGVHDERIIAAEFERWLQDRNGRLRGERYQHGCGAAPWPARARQSRDRAASGNLGIKPMRRESRS
jgi:NAD(P)-dependent dehydrogenase (short-subunit alcohol dehydrogenase family)